VVSIKNSTPFFTRIRISHQVFCPRTHQQNGVVERKHRHIVEVGLSLLAHTHMSLKYWDEAFATAAYLINRTPSHVIDGQTPLLKLSCATPDYSQLRVFRCACCPNLRLYNARKLSFWSTRCVFLGYSNLHKGYKCLDVASGRVYILRDVVFDESVFPFFELNPNAGAELKSEIMLLHPTLITLTPLENAVENHVNNSHIPAENPDELTEISDNEEKCSITPTTCNKRQPKVICLRTVVI
jgi:hypothetical protein